MAPYAPGSCLTPGCPLLAASRVSTICTSRSWRCKSWNSSPFHANPRHVCTSGTAARRQTTNQKRHSPQPPQVRYVVPVNAFPPCATLAWPTRSHGHMARLLTLPCHQVVSVAEIAEWPVRGFHLACRDEHDAQALADVAGTLLCVLLVNSIPHNVLIGRGGLEMFIFPRRPQAPCGGGTCKPPSTFTPSCAWAPRQQPLTPPAGPPSPLWQAPSTLRSVRSRGWPSLSNPSCLTQSPRATT